MHSKCREQPTFNSTIVQCIHITDVVLIRFRLAIDNDAKHSQDGVAMAVKRRTLQRVAVDYAIIHPLLVQFAQGQLMIGPKRINNPDVLVKYLSWFHACKDTKKAESKKTFGSIF